MNSVKRHHRNPLQAEWACPDVINKGEILSDLAAAGWDVVGSFSYAIFIILG